MRRLASLVIPILLVLPASAQASGVLAWGSNWHGESNVPPLPPGLSYLQVDSGMLHCAAVRSDGQAVAWGYNSMGQCDVPPPPAGTRYVKVSTGMCYDPDLSEITGGLRSDGQVVVWGNNASGACNVPRLPRDVRYVDLALGGRHGVALRSDGQIAAWGEGSLGQLDVPPLPSGMRYVDVAACQNRSGARRSDGTLLLWGDSFQNINVVPTLPAGVVYTSVSLAPEHTVALRSDGQIESWGPYASQFPALPAGMTYIAVHRTFDGGVAVRSDGTLHFWGSCYYGMCTPPTLPAGSVFLEAAGSWTHMVARYGPPPQAPSIYCTAKPSSLGCAPSIGWRGTLSTTGADNFAVTATGIRNQRSGMLFWGQGPSATPFYGGLKCVAAPLARMRPLASGGSTGVDDCSGSFDQPIARAYLLQHALLYGTDLYFQFWYRDGSIAPFQVGLTDALHARVDL